MNMAWLASFKRSDRTKPHSPQAAVKPFGSGLQLGAIDEAQASGRDLHDPARPWHFTSHGADHVIIPLPNLPGGGFG